MGLLSSSSRTGRLQGSSGTERGKVLQAARKASKALLLSHNVTSALKSAKGPRCLFTHTMDSSVQVPFETQLCALRVLENPFVKLFSCVLDFVWCQTLSKRAGLNPAFWQQFQLEIWFHSSCPHKPMLYRTKRVPKQELSLAGCCVWTQRVAAGRGHTQHRAEGAKSSPWAAQPSTALRRLIPVFKMALTPWLLKNSVSVSFLFSFRKALFQQLCFANFPLSHQISPSFLICCQKQPQCPRV